MLLYTYEVRNLETQIQEVKSWLTGIEQKGIKVCLLRF